MLTCVEFTQLVGDYVEGRLSFWERVRFQVHIVMCAPCGIYARQLQLAKSTVGCLPEAPIPEPARDAMLERFRAWKLGEDVSPPPAAHENE